MPRSQVHPHSSTQVEAQIFLPLPELAHLLLKGSSRLFDAKAASRLLLLHVVADRLKCLRNAETQEGQLAAPKAQSALLRCSAAPLRLCSGSLRDAEACAFGAKFSDSEIPYLL